MHIKHTKTNSSQGTWRGVDYPLHLRLAFLLEETLNFTNLALNHFQLIWITQFGARVEGCEYEYTPTLVLARGL